MPDNLVIVPSDGDGYVELARTQTGRLFRKQILAKGKLRHPNTGNSISIDDEFVSSLKKNFSSGVCPIVQVPLANANNEHSEDPSRNIGEVIGIEDQGDKIYALIDVRDDDAASKMGKTLLGASAMLHMNYLDTKTGEGVGPTLLHTCVTNRPYVTGLDDYEEVLSATSDSTRDGTPVVLLSEATKEETDESTKAEEPAEEKEDMPEEQKDQGAPKATLEELYATLKTEHGIDVPALKAKADEGSQAAALSKTLVDALSEAGVVKLTNAEEPGITSEDVVGAVKGLADNNVTLTNRVNTLERQSAETEVADLVKQGRILPAKKDKLVELRLSNSELFYSLLPEEPIVKLSNEVGANKPEDKTHTEQIDAEIARLTAAYIAPSK